MVSLLFTLLAAVALDETARPQARTLVEEINSKYEQEMKEYERIAIEFLDRREAETREKGDKLSLDQRKKESDNFRRNSELPDAAPATLKNRPLKALENLEAAYDDAISAATKLGDDAAAAELEKALSVAREKAGYPSIAGVWYEGDPEDGIEIVVRQKADKFLATCEYSHKVHGTIRWRMSGTIRKDGTVAGRLVHVRAPADFKDQDREARIDRKTNTIAGKASWTGGEHVFEWKAAK